MKDTSHEAPNRVPTMVSRMALMTAPPSAHVIGMPITMRTPSTTSRAMAEIIMMPFLPLSHELGVGVVHRSSAPSSETESTACAIGVISPGPCHAVFTPNCSAKIVSLRAGVMPPT